MRTMANAIKKISIDKAQSETLDSYMKYLKACEESGFYKKQESILQNRMNDFSKEVMMLNQIA